MMISPHGFKFIYRNPASAAQITNEGLGQTQTETRAEPLKNYIFTLDRSIA